MPTNLPQAATDPQVQRSYEGLLASAIRICHLWPTPDDHAWAAKASAWASEAPVKLGHASLVVPAPAYTATLNAA